MGVGKDEKVYNINADIAAGFIAKNLKSRRLLLMTDVDGVLDKNKSLIPEINSEKAKEMIDQGTITGGMIPKINTCLDAVKNGVYQVCQSEVENEKVGNSSHPLVSWKHISLLSRAEKNFWYINGIDCLELG